MNWQIVCDWLWAPIIAPFATYCIGKLVSRWKYGRQLFRKLTLGNPKIALIADHTEQNRTTLANQLPQQDYSKKKILRAKLSQIHIIPHFITDLISSSSCLTTKENPQIQKMTSQITNKKRQRGYSKNTTTLSKQQTSRLLFSQKR